MNKIFAGLPFLLPDLPINKGFLLNMVKITKHYLNVKRILIFSYFM